MAFRLLPLPLSCAYLRTDLFAVDYGLIRIVLSTVKKLAGAKKMLNHGNVCRMVPGDRP